MIRRAIEATAPLFADLAAKGYLCSEDDGYSRVGALVRTQVYTNGAMLRFDYDQGGDNVPLLLDIDKASVQRYFDDAKTDPDHPARECVDAYHPRIIGCYVLHNPHTDTAWLGVAVAFTPSQTSPPKSYSRTPQSS